MRQRLYLLTAVALAPALVILLYNEVVTRGEREIEVHRSAMRVGELASLEMQRIMDGAEGMLRVVARSPSVREFDTGSCESFLADLTTQTPQFLSVSAVDSQGLIRCRSTAPGTEIRLSEREYFRDVMATGKFIIGTYQLGDLSREPTLPLAVPIFSRSGTIKGVLVAGLSLKWLNSRIADRRFPDNDALTLADRYGVIIARHPYPERYVGTRIPDEYLHLLTADGPGTARGHESGRHAAHHRLPSRRDAARRHLHQRRRFVRRRHAARISGDGAWPSHCGAWRRDRACACRVHRQPAGAPACEPRACDNRCVAGRRYHRPYRHVARQRRTVGSGRGDRRLHGRAARRPFGA
ncbi:cache domain-containing protein [Mesorhizobium sp. AaZ16]